MPTSTRTLTLAETLKARKEARRELLHCVADGTVGGPRWTALNAWLETLNARMAELGYRVERAWPSARATPTPSHRVR